MSAERVAQRLKKRYKDPYGFHGRTAFVPDTVYKAVECVKKNGVTMMEGKAATPDDGARDPTNFFNAKRPLYHMVERSSEAQTEIFRNYAATLEQTVDSDKYTCGTIAVTSGTKMQDQFDAWYLGMAFPAAIPAAVGGYDVDHKKRWRRPAEEAIQRDNGHEIMRWLQPFTTSGLTRHSLSIGGACAVSLYDLTKGYAQRIEGNFRRDLMLPGGMWNMYFKHQLRTKWNLGLQRAIDSGEPGSSCAESVRVALKGIYKALDHGEYLTWDNKKKKLTGIIRNCKLLLDLHLSSRELCRTCFSRLARYQGRRKCGGKLIEWFCGHA